ncbi:hypothetical protein BD560DRAFT_438301 [Blakeslea trispora]|nr:hypothetical protein BD560DRAFT_438301 [Blakeslea trispora]
MGLQKSSVLNIGAKYMITNNLDTSEGLTDDTTGTLKKIEYGQCKENPSSKPVQKAIKVWLLFDDANSGKKRRAAHFANPQSTSFKLTKPLSPTKSIAIELERQSGVKLKTKFDELIERISSYQFQLTFYNLQSLNAHIDQIKNDKTYLSSDFLLFAETRLAATQNFSIPGFEEVSRVDVEGAIARANGSICFAKSSLIEQNPVSNKIQQLIIDGNNHKIAIPAFILNDLLIASIYRSPRFDAEK